MIIRYLDPRGHNDGCCQLVPPWRLEAQYPKLKEYLLNSAALLSVLEKP